MTVLTIFDSDRPDDEAIARILREERALYVIGWAPTMGRVEGPHGPKLGTVGYVFVLGRGGGESLLVDTDLELRVTESRLIVPLVQR